MGAEPLEVRQRILARLAHKPGRTRRRWEHRVAAATANLPEEFSWTNILPLKCPPPAVNIVPRRWPVGFNTPDEAREPIGRQDVARKCRTTDDAPKLIESDHFPRPSSPRPPG